MKHPPCCLLNKSKNFMSQTLEIIANLADCWVCVLFFLVIQRPWTFSGQATNVELPLYTGGRCHKWRILLRRSYTSSICMIPFVSCCEKTEKLYDICSLWYRPGTPPPPWSGKIIQLGGGEGGTPPADPPEKFKNSMKSIEIHWNPLKSIEIQWNPMKSNENESGLCPTKKNCKVRELNQCGPDSHFWEGLRSTIEVGEHFRIEAPLQYLHVFWWHFSFHERQTRSLKERKQTRSLKERKQTRTFDTAEIGL